MAPPCKDVATKQRFYGMKCKTKGFVDKEEGITLSAGEESCETLFEDFPLVRVCCTCGQAFP
jgi:hypothetical protein